MNTTNKNKKYTKKFNKKYIQKGGDAFTDAVNAAVFTAGMLNGPGMVGQLTELIYPVIAKKATATAAPIASEEATAGVAAPSDAVQGTTCYTAKKIANIGDTYGAFGALATGAAIGGTLSYELTKGQQPIVDKNNSMKSSTQNSEASANDSAQSSAQNAEKQQQQQQSQENQ